MFPIFVVLFAIAQVPEPVPFSGEAPTVIEQPNFSPGDACKKRSLQAINEACDEILMWGYNFTDRDYADALVAAHKRIRRVEVILDSRANKTNKNSVAKFLQGGGVTTWLDSRHKIAHSKTIVVDGQLVIVGSFNWSNAARSNLEHQVALHSEQLAAPFRDNFEQHKNHAERY